MEILLSIFRFLGELGSQTGWFPANFVEEMEPEVDDDESLEDKLAEVTSDKPRLK